MIFRSAVAIGFRAGEKGAIRTRFVGDRVGGGDGGGGVVATDEIPMFIHGAPNKAIADVYLERRAVIIIIINHILS